MATADLLRGSLRKRNTRVRDLFDDQPIALVTPLPDLDVLAAVRRDGRVGELNAVPTAFVGTVMSDLSGRRARVTGNDTDPEDDERSGVRAQLPEAELIGYATALRGVSHGTGSFTRRPLGFAPAPR
jgi:hypothetical protein